MKHCKFCGKTFDYGTRRRVFCSSSCKAKWRYRNVQAIKKICQGCGKEYTCTGVSPEQFCRSCSTRVHLAGREGSASQVWRGGHKYWLSGKCGLDKDGLSWKAQRRLAWERDHYTCQDCGKTRAEMGYKPHCHHIKPYRLSFSHALSNLVSLCRSCHKKWEARNRELWGGRILGEQVSGFPVQVLPACRLCLKRRKLDVDGYCRSCRRERVDKPLALKLRQEGFSYEIIAGRLGLDHGTVWHWLNPVVDIAQVV